MTDRPRAIEGIQAAIADDLERQVRQMVRAGWTAEEAFRAVRVFWSQRFREATRTAKESLGDILR